MRRPRSETTGAFRRCDLAEAVRLVPDLHPAPCVLGVGQLGGLRTSQRTREAPVWAVLHEALELAVPVLGPVRENADARLLVEPDVLGTRRHDTRDAQRRV